MTEEVIKQYLKNLIDKGSIESWDGISSADYKYISYSNLSGIIIILCEYYRLSYTFHKSIAVEEVDILQYIRDNKLNNLGI